MGFVVLDRYLFNSNVCVFCLRYRHKWLEKPKSFNTLLRAFLLVQTAR